VDTHAKPKSSPATGIKGYRLFRIFGFEVKLNLTWLLLGLLITWTLAVGLFPFDYPGLAVSTYWWMGVAGAIGILFSIVFHELSHSLVARHYGLSIGGITLFIFGGVAEMQEEPASPKIEFLMSVAGPVASIVLALILFEIERLIIAQQWATSAQGVIHYLAVVNLIVAAFNLIPAFPLDGGRMLRAALWHWKKNLRSATRIASGVGSAFGIFLMLFGVFAFISGNFIGGMWWFLIGIFLRSAASMSYRQLQVRELLSDKPVSDFMSKHPITVPPSTSVEDWMENYVYKHHFKMFPVVEGSELRGCITTDDLKKISRDQWSQKTVDELRTPCDGNTVSPDTSSEKLLADMTRQNANTRYMVVENNHLVGMISMKDLREYIALKMELESR
jgi:Zn-dependent protease/predicted transcriptional regulator